MARTERYFIGPKLLGDIRRVVSRVGGQPDAQSRLRIPTALQDLPTVAGGSGLRRATFTGAWNKNTIKTITFYGTTTTVSAFNVLTTIDTGCGDPREAFVTKVDGAWHLIAAECA